MPGLEANAWLREKVLGFCKIPMMEASRPVKNVVILERVNSSRLSNFSMNFALMPVKFFIFIIRN